MKNLAIAFIFSSMLICSCATTPVPTSSAVMAPPDRVLDQSYLVKRSDTGEIIVKRDEGFTGSACSSRIFLNAVAVADIMPSEKVVLYIDAGEFFLGANPNGICGGRLSELKSKINVGETLTFRVGYGSNGDFSIQPTAF